jgi:2-polyprenyl-3-methyl-5-hydroxy-6-metoxy-1,4-benzoquinol methylase
MNINNHDLLQQCQDHLLLKYPMLKGVLNLAITSRQRDLANEVLNYHTALRGREHLLTKGLDAFAKVSFDFLRYQALFEKKGTYVQKQEQELAQELYASHKMADYYLDGLMLTYALWTNHIAIYEFFKLYFTSGFHAQSKVLELAFGHGLMAITALKQSQPITYYGYDLSPFSVTSTRQLLLDHQINPHCFHLSTDNILTSPVLSEGSIDYGICCELLEHVKNPDKILTAFARYLSQEGRLFITTVANLAAEDHIYLFNNVGEIHQLIDQAGFAVQEERVLTLPGYQNDRYTPLNYAAILTKKNKDR